MKPHLDELENKYTYFIKQNQELEKECAKLRYKVRRLIKYKKPKLLK